MITDVAMARMVRPGVVTKPLSFLQRPKYFPPGSKIETILTVQVINLRLHLPLCVDPHPLNGTNFQICMACYRRKSTVWLGKLISSKKTPKNSVFLRRFFGITSLWEDLEAKLLTPGQLLGYP